MAVDIPWLIQALLMQHKPLLKVTSASCGQPACLPPAGC